jgi:hypothetical protein
VTGGFAVDDEALRLHAQHLDSIAADAALAADAADQVDLTDGAFGLLCAFLPPFVNDAEVSTGNSVRAVHETLQAAAEGVRAMARDYADTDDRVRTAADTLLGNLQ